MGGGGTVEGYTRLQSPHDFINSPWTRYHGRQTERRESGIRAYFYTVAPMAFNGECNALVTGDVEQHRLLAI